MSLKEYNADSIKQLTFRDGCRKRIGIYLGSADHTGVIAGLLELVNNATDEALVHKAADRVELVIGPDWASCRDYGRGMPHGPNEFSKEVMINLLTENHSGAKFDENAYGGKSRGLNGTGSAATCCSSDWFEISSYRDGAEWFMRFEDGIPRFDVCQKKPLGKSKQGTYIKYKPSQEVFISEPIKFDYNAICDIMKEYSYFNKGITFSVTNSETGEERNFISKNGLIDFAKDHIENPIHKTPLHIATTEDGIDIEIILQWTTGKECFYLFSNGGENENGGTPITGIKTAITNFMKKQFKGYDGDMARSGLTYICSVNLKNPIYDGQTKSKITNPELRGLAQRAAGQVLNDFAVRNKPEFEKIIDYLTKMRKAEAAAERVKRQVLETSKEIENTTKKRTILADKLKDCRVHGHNSGSVLAVAEGDSALGALVQARPIDSVALLPIRGKIISALKHPDEKILQNEEVKAIFSALGCGFFERYNSSKLRYQYVGIASDADVDGANIACLIITLFYHLCPQFLKEGRLLYMRMPLFVLKYKKDKILYAFSEKEKEELIKKHGKPKEIGRKKGIGENTPQETAEAVFGPQRRWEQLVINNEKDFKETIEMLMGKEVDNRKQFIMDNVDFSLIGE